MPNKNYKLSAEFYDLLHKNEVESLAKKLVSHLYPYGIPEGSDILDLGCGTGTLLENIYSAKSRFLGIDLAPEMIDIAIKKYQHIEFIAMDMCAVNLKRSFDLILCTNDAINYLIPESRVLLFELIANHLKNNGSCYIDFDTETDIVGCWDGQISYNEGNGWQVTRSSFYDAAKRIGIERQNWIVIEDGELKKITEIHNLYPLSPKEVTELAEKFGMFVEYFIEPSQFIRLEDSFESYLRLGCLLRI
ncbi:unannotated protein [freshwater metagenome]|uniref:Unannotated protein n=1 Tax=freshwater metagenome TaxID=449393 RepID=A0A6J6Z4E1_9ZZZZ|nr:methyltransferase domain-containing protein [Actinomycetota bacterium]